MWPDIPPPTFGGGWNVGWKKTHWQAILLVLMKRERERETERGKRRKEGERKREKKKKAPTARASFSQGEKNTLEVSDADFWETTPN